jgi:hypothetical protein
MAIARGLAFFGVRATWVAIDGEEPRTPLLRCAPTDRCAWLSSVRGARCVVSKSGETPEPPLSPELGLAAALGLAIFGARASLIVVVGGDPETPFSAALGLAAVLGFCGG